MELSFAAATDVGRQRDHNEDNFLIDKKLRLFIVCDGMGGHAAGEVASSITVHQIRDAVFSNRYLVQNLEKAGKNLKAQDTSSAEILKVMEQAIQDACATVYNRAQEEPDKHGMGTTASALLIAGEPDNLRGFIAHVGDSRIYLTRKSQCHQLTEDHSLVNELIRRGKIKEGEFDTSPYKKFKNAVTRAVGIYETVEVDTLDFDILPGDNFLLCSDGMYEYFEEEQLPTLLTDGEVKSIPKALIDRANAGGGHDNITNVVIRVQDISASQDLGPRAAELSLKLEVLKSMELFRYLSYKELVSLMKITNACSFSKGERVITKGENGECMFIVLSGSLQPHDEQMQITPFHKGHHFGEMALVDKTPRSLSVTALEDCRLLTISRKDFYNIIKKQPAMSVKLLWSFVQVLAGRLRTTTAELSDVLKLQTDNTSIDE